MSTFLEALGIPLAQPFAEANLTRGLTWSWSATPSHAGIVELEHVLDQRIPFCSLPQILHDEFLVGKEVLVVAGTHGKTTTTSMLAWIFDTAGLKAIISDWRDRRKLRQQLSGSGEGRHFILEGDEYDTAFFDKGPKFLHYFPDASILTSVEFDHADIYKDLDAVETAFKRLVNLVPRRGRIVAFDSGESLERCRPESLLPGRTVWFHGWRRTGELQISSLETRRTPWSVLRDGKPWADFEFALAGEYNVWNATAAAALAANCGIPKAADCEGFQDFQEREAATGSEGARKRRHHHRRLRASSHRHRADAPGTAFPISGSAAVGDPGAAFEYHAAQRAARRAG